MDPFIGDTPPRGALAPRATRGKMKNERGLTRGRLPSRPLYWSYALRTGVPCGRLSAVYAGTHFSPFFIPFFA